MRKLELVETTTTTSQPTCRRRTAQPWTYPSQVVLLERPEATTEIDPIRTTGGEDGDEAAAERIRLTRFLLRRVSCHAYTGWWSVLVSLTLSAETPSPALLSSCKQI